MLNTVYIPCYITVSNIIRIPETFNLIIIFSDSLNFFNYFVVLCLVANPYIKPQYPLHFIHQTQPFLFSSPILLSLPPQTLVKFL